MIRLKKTYAKVVDRLTLELAPEECDGVVGFNNNAEMCLTAGYLPVKYTQGEGVPVYAVENNVIVQSWVTIDTQAYAVRVVQLIREKYSENEELAILRKGLAGIDGKAFKEYNEYCEACKKVAKNEMIN